ncbi:hypothetical protein [Paenibacillus sp. BJ-4]|nr:hypothetical protein [Paenibacillus sp. BJ-4]
MDYSDMELCRSSRAGDLNPKIAHSPVQRRLHTSLVNDMVALI